MKSLHLFILTLVVAGLLLVPLVSVMADPGTGKGGAEPDASFWEQAPSGMYGPKAESLSDKPADDEPKLQVDSSEVEVEAQGMDPAVATWHVIENEGFEGVWPDAGWSSFDYNRAAVGGSFTWDDTSRRAKTGSWSAHPTDGAIPYGIFQHTKMTFGPFSLVGATDAKFSFSYFLATEAFFDFFSWEYSCDGGTSWVSQQKSGSSAGLWKTVTQSIKTCAGKPSVFVQFTFVSDDSFGLEGAYVDNVLIQKFQ